MKYRIEDYVGTKVHGWTVVREVPVEERKLRDRSWIVKCPKCDAEIERVTADIFNIKRVQVSCRYCVDHGSRLRKGPTHPCWTGGKIVSGWYYTRLKQSATSRGIAFEVTIEYLESIWTGHCAYTNLEVHIDGSDITASVDRIDSGVGYVEGNLQWVHKDVNRMKSDLKEVRFLELCNLINNKATGRLEDVTAKF